MSGMHWFKDGELTKKYSHYEKSSSSQPTLLSDGTVFVKLKGKNRTYMDAVWLKDGVEMHKIAVGTHRTGGSSPVVLENDVVVFGADNGFLYYMKDAEVLFKLPVHAPVSTTPIIWIVAWQLWGHCTALFIGLKQVRTSSLPRKVSVPA